MQKIPSLNTDRLLLRAPEDRDVDAYAEFYADAEASHFYGGPKTVNEAWNRLARDLGHWHLRGYGTWTLESKADGRIVGGCGLLWPGGWPRSELTWWIASSARRMGFAKEASKAVIRYGYDTLGWDLVQTHMNDKNTAAKALVLSLGGVPIAREQFPDGLTRDVYRLPRP